MPVNPRRAGVEARPYEAWGTFPQCNYVVHYPTEGASGTPPPTGCAIVCVSAEP